LQHQPSSARKIKNGLATRPIGPEDTRPTPRRWRIGPSPVSGGGIGAPQSVSGDCTLVASGAITCLWPGVKPVQCRERFERNACGGAWWNGRHRHGMDDLCSVALCGTATLHCERVKSKTTGKTTGAQLDITVASGTATVDYVLADT